MNSTKLALVAFRCCFNSDYRFLRRLRIFDGGYYLTQSDNTETPISDPLWHYLSNNNVATIEDRIPGDGWRQCGDPHPLFDSAYYLTINRSTGEIPSSANPFIHYLRKGWKEGLRPGPYFDPEIYEERTDWDENKGDPLTHYTHFGKFLGVSPGLSFDIDFYLDKNPVLVSVGPEIIKHYKLHGAKIGKTPLPVFDPSFYLKQLEDSQYAKQDPLAHYLTTTHEGESPAPWFDPEFYTREYKIRDRAISIRNALIHYVTHGVHKGYCTNESVNALQKKPLISIVVPVYNPDLKVLGNCIRSVLYQAYPHWELCLADDCSTQPGVCDTLLAWAERDPRIKVMMLEQNSGIAAATNAAITLADGDFIGFLDNDDELAGDALYWVVDCITQSDGELIYTDEELIGDDGSRLSIFRKPDYNNELLLSHNYITHFVVVAKRLLEAVGGLDSTFDGAQDYDLLLRLTEKTQKIRHLAKLLYKWRASETSTSVNHDQKNYAHEAGKAALAAALDRRLIPAYVEDMGLNYFYRFSPRVDQYGRVSIFLWVDEDSSAYRNGLHTLFCSTEYKEISFIIIAEPEVFSSISEYLEKHLEGPGDIEHHAVKHGTTKGEALHQAIMSVDSEYLGFIDVRLKKITTDWLEQLLGCLLLSDIGLVNGRVQFGGGDGRSFSLPELDKVTVCYYLKFLQYHTRHLNGVHCLQEVSCCGTDITALKRQTYIQLGGFDSDRYPEYFYMADFAMRLRVAGEKICYTPNAVVDFGAGVDDHFPPCDEGKTAMEEKELFQKRWQRELGSFGRYYNPGILEDNKLDQTLFLTWLGGKSGDLKPSS